MTVTQSNDPYDPSDPLTHCQLWVHNLYTYQSSARAMIGFSDKQSGPVERVSAPCRRCHDDHRHLHPQCDHVTICLLSRQLSAPYVYGVDSDAVISSRLRCITRFVFDVDERLNSQSWWFIRFQLKLHGFYLFRILCTRGHGKQFLFGTIGPVSV